VATDPEAAEEGSDPGIITVRRTGGNLASPLPVFISRGPSTATSGVDYASLGGGTFLVTIPSGAAEADIAIVPVDDALVEGDETVSLLVAANAAYLIGTPGDATVLILDND